MRKSRTNRGAGRLIVCARLPAENPAEILSASTSASATPVLPCVEAWRGSPGLVVVVTVSWAAGSWMVSGVRTGRKSLSAVLTSGTPCCCCCCCAMFTVGLSQSVLGDKKECTVKLSEVQCLTHPVAHATPGLSFLLRRRSPSNR